MANETCLIDAWLYSTLAGDATLMALITGVFADVAPEGQAYPFLVFSLQDAGDVQTVNNVRLLVDATYQVRITTDAESFGAIKTAVERVDTLLHRASGTVTGGVIYDCVRAEPLRYTELQQGRLYRHLGGLYRIQVQ